MAKKKVNKYWHKLSDKEVNKLCDNHKTIGYLMENYLQPEWCSYPGALGGMMGCWSLMDKYGLRKKISIGYCKNCDCFKNKKN